MCFDFGMMHTQILCDGDKVHSVDGIPRNTQGMRARATVGEAEKRHINRRHEDGTVYLSQRQSTCYNGTSDAAPTA